MLRKDLEKAQRIRETARQKEVKGAKIIEDLEAEIKRLKGV